jgi:hypothetical protein
VLVLQDELCGLTDFFNCRLMQTRGGCLIEAISHLFSVGLLRYGEICRGGSYIIQARGRIQSTKRETEIKTRPSAPQKNHHEVCLFWVANRDAK